ncbi:hypothetical protein ANAPC1_00142 [Anaplasma phagocytophilum]|uniref:Uncharacterized protein n=1 Tax=Anaplasma phagocytophilum TaxID=948 RepID=A0AA45US36_ANAPH|nr:hypothetical protein ANAPC1_00142 [Anaplasma phagocytophilum]
MYKGCCGDEKPSILSRVRQSMLCGVYGSLVFSVSAMSYLQASIFLKVCGRYYLTKRAHDAHSRNLDAAKQNMKRGLIPAVEMFIIMPVMFYVLHSVFSVPWIYCLIACWATMFAICMAVRLAGIVKNCPDFETPIYSRGYPFPRMKDESGNFHDDDDLERAGEPAMHIPKYTAYLLGFAFLGLRLLSAIAFVLLSCLELICAPFTFAIEFFRRLSSLVKGGSVSPEYMKESYAAGLAGLNERIVRAGALIRAAGQDLLWVVSFGISGATRLKDATLFWDSGWEDVEPEVQPYREMSEHRKDGKDGRGGGSCCHKKKEGTTAETASVSSSQFSEEAETASVSSSQFSEEAETASVSSSQFSAEEGVLQKVSQLGLSKSLGALEEVVVQGMGARSLSAGAF